MFVKHKEERRCLQWQAGAEPQAVTQQLTLKTK